MDIEHSATYEALPAHLKPVWLRTVRALPPAWLNAPATGEVFKGKDDCMHRLQGWALFEGFAVVQGRVWNDQTPRWQFLCKQHGTKTANKRDLEARKGKDEEGNVVIDRQRDTMIKAKKDCHIECNLSYKPVSRGSSEKQYIGAGESQGGSTIIVTSKTPVRPPPPPERSPSPLPWPSGPSTLHGAGEVPRARPEEETGAYKQVY